MTDFLTLGLSPKQAIGRCPHCKEFIDLSVLKCRFCRTVIRRKDALKAIALQERINRKVAAENDARARRSTLAIRERICIRDGDARQLRKDFVVMDEGLHTVFFALTLVRTNSDFSIER